MSFARDSCQTLASYGWSRHKNIPPRQICFDCMFSFDSHAIQNSPWPQEHLSSLSQSTPCWNLNSKSRFNALCTCEWQLYPQGSLGGTLIGPSTPTCLKLAPIKYEKSFVLHHMKSHEGLFWKSRHHLEFLEFKTSFAVRLQPPSLSSDSRDSTTSGREAKSGHYESLYSILFLYKH